MRYQFYREHKYVSAALNDVERQIARTDFRENVELETAEKAFHALSEMLRGHAEYENERLHPLLEKKHSTVHREAASDHTHQEEQLQDIQLCFDRIKNAKGDEEKVSCGYQLYLTFRKFVADNLHHLHEEETKILPELQRLYPDEDLRLVEAKTYAVMTSEDMVEMIHVLFPQMNASDREAFLTDIYLCEPKKFASVWTKIAPTLNAKERTQLQNKLCST